MFNEETRLDLLDGAKVAFPIETDPSILVQRDLTKNMREHGPGEFCMNDPWTDKPLTYGEAYDMHAMTMLVIDEVEKRATPTKDPTDERA